MERTKERSALVAGKLELWDKLELVFEDHGRSGRYRTRLEDVTGEHLIIDRPSLIAGDALFTEGAEFTAYFYKPDSAYAFNGKILGKNPEGLDTYLIPRPKTIDRNQRRRYYRIEVDMPAVLLPADELLSGKLESDDVPEFEAVCLNLSGNGTLCRTRFGANITDKLFVALRVNDINREFCFLGVIRRQDPTDEGWNNYGIEFFTVEEQQMLLSNAQLQRVPKRYHSFTETHRTTLLNYIFSQQVALKKRGLL